MVISLPVPQLAIQSSWNYITVKMVLQKLCYDEYNWIVCVDLKRVNFQLGLQGSYTK